MSLSGLESKADHDDGAQRAAADDTESESDEDGARTDIDLEVVGKVCFLLCVTRCSQCVSLFQCM